MYTLIHFNQNHFMLYTLTKPFPYTLTKPGHYTLTKPCPYPYWSNMHDYITSNYM